MVVDYDVAHRRALGKRRDAGSSPRAITWALFTRRSSPQDERKNTSFPFASAMARRMYRAASGEMYLSMSGMENILS